MKKEEVRKILAERMVEEYWDEFLKAYWLQKCGGCPDGHSSFWRTVVLSPQWKLWQKEQIRRNKNGRIVKGKWIGQACYDMSEVEELGIISPGHFQEFLKFCKKI